MRPTAVTDHIIDISPGFGIDADWDVGWEVLTLGHSMPFMEALKVSAETLMLRAAVPRWLLSLSQRGRRAIRGYMEIEASN